MGKFYFLTIKFHAHYYITVKAYCKQYRKNFSAKSAKILKLCVYRTGDNVVLLFLGELCKVDGIARYPDCELRVFFGVRLLNTYTFK